MKPAICIYRTIQERGINKARLAESLGISSELLQQHLKEKSLTDDQIYTLKSAIHKMSMNAIKKRINNRLGLRHNTREFNFSRKLRLTDPFTIDSDEIFFKGTVANCIEKYPELIARKVKKYGLLLASDSKKLLTSKIGDQFLAKPKKLFALIGKDGEGSPRNNQAKPSPIITGQWNPVKGFEGYYEINSEGEVRSLDRKVKLTKGKERFYSQRTIAQRIDSQGYATVRLSKDGSTHTKYVHKLVAEAFLVNSASKKYVNHKNGNKQDNSLSNLEWVTHSENIKHAHASGLINTRKQKVINSSTGKVYQSIKGAAKDSNIPYSTLKNYLNGNRTNQSELETFN
ncbi:MAG: HNH endonuclease [Chitinophagales bacterium]|nr:HNH endonuclease [Chitinophagales bacterium]